MKQIISRITAPTPSFFKKLRNIGLALIAVATTIVTAPITMPAIVVTIAGYLAVAGGVLSAVSQTAVESE
jgi:ABC-type xylose transport system permease subunit